VGLSTATNAEDTTMTFRTHIAAASLAVAFLQPHAVMAQSNLAGETFHISRAAGSIKVDGNLSDEGWNGVTPFSTWYEINPGDNTPPKVRNVGRIAYDDHFLYAAFEFDDPNPRAIRAPYSDRDDSGNGFYDFGGLFIDAGGSGHTARLFVATPRNIQADSIIDDASGEDTSPDFFWESATRITDHGWVLEMRIPFTSLRYQNSDPHSWAILLYRNYPRDQRYQFLSARMPRGYNCFVCHANVLEGRLRTSAPAPAHGPRQASVRRSRTATRSMSAWTSSSHPTRTRSSTSPSSPISPRWSLTWRRFPQTSASRYSYRKSARFSWRALISSRRRFRRSTHAPSRHPAGAGG
jgi:hypothetical protein